MTTLLHISSSPRGPEESESLALAATFIEQYTQVHPDVEVRTFDLWDGSLPDFGRGAARAKMAVFAGEDPSGERAAPWAKAIATFERFAAADSYLFSVPMWNHGIPYILKQLIDVISQPGYLFDFDVKRGYTGRLHGKKAAVLYTSAVYGRGLAPEFGHDFQSTYLRDWLVWAGVTEVSEAEFRPNLVTADAVTQRAIAHAEVTDLAKAF